MLSLDDRDWNPFTIEEIFTISSGKRLETRNKIPGIRPFAGAVDSSNGISGFVGNTNESLDKHVLGVNYNGSVGLCFYHPYEIIFSDDVKRFHLINYPDNHRIMLFMKVVIEQQRIKYSYGYKFNATRMSRQTILLPTDILGEPDWKFMEDYIREREEMLIERCRKFLMKRIADIERERERVTADLDGLAPVYEKTWAAFPLASLGAITSGRDIYAQERTDGKTPYVTSGSQNNGIGYFVGNCNETLDSGYIALNRNGAVGKAFYHPYLSLMGNDCRKLHLKAADNNEFVGNFISVAISMQSKCFSYSRKLGTARAKALRVMLPTDESGKPDWQYMEDYAKSIALKLLRQQLAYLTA